MNAKHLILLFFVFQINHLFAQDSLRLFVFGHSLIDHRPPLNPTPSDETTVPHWMYLFAQDSGDSFAAGGQYGFLPQHQNLPPFSQWGYDIVPGVWESDYEAFSAAGINTVFITVGNFIQNDQAPGDDYYGMPGINPLSATETIMDWCENESSPVTIYIYENWPDMAPYLSGGFPGTANDFQNYNQYVEGAFHDWWINYQDQLIISRPSINVRMIPVGPVISGVLRDVLNNDLGINDLYEDDAPHGRPEIYFLAGLISYMSVYEKEAPDNYNVPTLIHPIIRDNYTEIRDYIWNALLSFNDASGNSRVFKFNPVSNVELNSNSICLLPNPNDGVFKITGLSASYNISICSINGTEVFNQNAQSEALSFNLSAFPDSIYTIKITNIINGNVMLEKMIKN